MGLAKQKRCSFVGSCFLNCFKVYGWRATARFNTLAMFALSLVMVACVITAIIRAGGLNKPLILYTGACGISGATGINTGLHVLINIFSTAILVSSGFFMQILNAPSRHEINRAHSEGSWLSVGVVSVGNAFRVSRVKTLTWLGFLVTSIPVHLLFNSAVFETDYRQSKFDIAFAIESFSLGGEYYPPGASLLDSGRLRNPYSHAYGNVSDSVSDRIRLMAQESGTWTRLDKDNCINEYQTCKGISQFRNVLVVVDGLPGWTRSDAWNFSQRDSAMADEAVPQNLTNSLWFYGVCEMRARYEHGWIYCQNSCNEPFNGLYKQNYYSIEPVDGNDLVLQYDYSTLVMPFYNNQSLIDWSSSYGMDSTAYQWDANDLIISYCLAEPVVPGCKVGLCTSILLAVTTCVVTKTALCILGLILLRDQAPLVTLGDAIESFILEPDAHTTGMCWLSQRKSRKRLMGLKVTQGPHQWLGRPRRQMIMVPITTWIITYSLLFGSALALFVFTMSVPSSTLFENTTGNFGKITPTSLIMQSVSLTKALLVINLPQLLLSLIHLFYNNLLTRLHMGKEWARMSTAYKGLRVTDPKGHQKTTYRLQIPYRYSIPVTMINIALHLLLSTAIYILISEGDYYDIPFSKVQTGPYLPPGAGISIGVSFVPSLILVTLLIMLSVSSLYSAFRHIPDSGPVVGCNSFAISAACHVSPLARPDPGLMTIPRLAGRQQQDEGDTELQNLKYLVQSSRPEESERSGSRITREKLSQSRLKWGVVEMPNSWCEKYRDLKDEVGHMSLGTMQNEIYKPIPGRYYA